VIDILNDNHFYFRFQTNQNILLESIFVKVLITDFEYITEYFFISGFVLLCLWKTSKQAKMLNFAKKFSSWLKLARRLNYIK
jgi:hypothetical protein